MVGSFSYAKEKLVDYKVALIFGLPSIITVYMVRRYLMPMLPIDFVFNGFDISKDLFIKILFSVLMLTASISLIRGGKKKEGNVQVNNSINYILTIFVYGFGVGIVTGIVGAGGGFLIMPTLILLTNLSVKRAVGTCLLILASKSLIGFVGDVQNDSFNWWFILGFCSCTVIGIFIGSFLSKRIPTPKLKSNFGYFEFGVSIIIIFKELILKLF